MTQYATEWQPMIAGSTGTGKEPFESLNASYDYHCGPLFKDHSSTPYTFATSTFALSTFPPSAFASCECPSYRQVLLGAFASTARASTQPTSLPSHFAYCSMTSPLVPNFTCRACLIGKV